MILGRPCKSYLSVQFRRLAATCAVLVDAPSTSSSASATQHTTSDYSKLEQLIGGSLSSSAQQVIQRIIRQSSSVSEAISVVDFASGRGFELDSATHGVLLSSGPQLAEELFYNKFMSGGAYPDPSILDCMVICFCRLEKFEEALTHFERLISLDYIPSRDAFNYIFRVLCAQGRVLEAFDYVVRVIGAGVCLGCWCFNDLIDGLCHKGFMEEALQLFDIMRITNKYRPSLCLFKSLFFGLCKRRWSVEVELLIAVPGFISSQDDVFFFDSRILQRRENEDGNASLF